MLILWTTSDCGQSDLKFSGNSIAEEEEKDKKLKEEEAVEFISGKIVIWCHPKWKFCKVVVVVAF